MGEGPGPKSKELQAERDRYLPRGMSSAMPVFAASGSGATLTDVDGQTFIDFATGISVMNVGHGHPRVLKAIKASHLSGGAGVTSTVPSPGTSSAKPAARMPDEERARYGIAPLSKLLSQYPEQKVTCHAPE